MGNLWSSEQPEKPELNLFPCFMPDQNCVKYVIEWIGYASEFIILQAYRFSSQEIADALIEAKGKGVNVTVYVDRNAKNQEGNLIQKLEDNGIKIEEDKHKGKAHNKVMIIDNERVIVGSYNWTDNEYYHNSDVIIFIKDECVTKKYTDNYVYNSSTNKKRKSSFKKPEVQERPFKKLSPLKLSPLFALKCDKSKDPQVRELIQALTVPNTVLSRPKDMKNNPSIRWRLGCCTVGLSDINVQERQKKKQSDHYVEVNVCFPRYDDQNCIKIICDYFKNAKKCIFIQASSFTHEDIANELIAAYEKKIDIKVLVNKTAFNDKGQKVDYLKTRGIEVKEAAVHNQGTAHSKIIIIDESLVLAGSFNLTKNAQEKNLENVLFMENKYVNDMFKSNFAKKWNQGTF